mgnify:CR=1 FL=1
MSRQRSILVVLYYYLPYISGLTEYARRLAEALVENGAEVTVVSTQYERDLPTDETIRGVRVLRYPVWMKFNKGVVSPAFMSAIVRLAKVHDVVQFHLPLPDAGLVAPFLTKSKVIVTYHCDVTLGRGLVNGCLEMTSYWLMNFAMANAKRIVGNSRQYFHVSRFAKYMNKFQQIYPPIDTSFFHKVPDIGFLQGFGVRGESYKIGFCGRLVYEKGISFLLESLRLLGEIDDLQLVIAGDDKNVAGGGIKTHLDTLAREHPDRVFFLGNLSSAELRCFYSEIDVLVLPSIDPNESFGMVQVEAMCCGTPVVASDLPGVNEVISVSGFGQLAIPRSAADLADKILRVYRHDFSETGFERHNWDIASTVASYLSLIEEVATSGS